MVKYFLCDLCSYVHGLQVTGADCISIKPIRLRREPKAVKSYWSVSISLRVSQVQHPFLRIQHSFHNIAVIIPPRLGGKKRVSRTEPLLVFVKTNIHLINTESLQFSDMYTSMHYWVYYFFLLWIHVCQVLACYLSFTIILSSQMCSSFLLSHQSRKHIIYHLQLS